MISLNVNAVASTSAFYLGQNNKNLQKSLNRLSTGFRINSSADDPGGLSVSMKLTASLRRNEAASTNVNSALSYLQTQDGALDIADSILLRMAELATLASSSTLSTSDRAAYNTELSGLKDYLGTLFSETFNGLSVFRTGDNTGTPLSTVTLPVVTSLENQTTGISSADLGAISYWVGSAAATGIVLTSATGATSAATAVNVAIQNLATIRAYNGAQQNRLTFALDLLEVNKVNLEAANSRIVDLDFATEMANYTRYSIIEQTNIALLSQANLRAENALRLLV